MTVLWLLTPAVPGAAMVAENKGADCKGLEDVVMTREDNAVVVNTEHIWDRPCPSYNRCYLRPIYSCPLLSSTSFSAIHQEQRIHRSQSFQRSLRLDPSTSSQRLYQCKAFVSPIFPQLSESTLCIRTSTHHICGHFSTTYKQCASCLSLRTQSLRTIPLSDQALKAISCGCRRDNVHPSPTHKCVNFLGLRSMKLSGSGEHVIRSSAAPRIPAAPPLLRHKKRNELRLRPERHLLLPSPHFHHRTKRTKTTPTTCLPPSTQALFQPLHHQDRFHFVTQAALLWQSSPFLLVVG